MSYRDRVAELAAIISAVPGAGQVHDRTRLTTRWADYLAAFRDSDGRINGWEITRKNGAPQPPRWQETYALRKIFGLRAADATDHEFQDHLDAVVRTLRDAELSFGSIAAGLNLVTIDERMFGDVLCHFADGELVVSLYYGNL